MIIPVYKPLGASTHQLAFQVGQFYGEKATHTGTLDPLAEGVVIVLTGDDRLRRSEFSKWHKVYEFSVAFGVNTDSFDLMGKIKDVNFDDVNIKTLVGKIQTWADELLGKMKQQIPDFSARRIDGQSAFDFAKKGIAIKKKFEEIEIFSCEFLGFEERPSTELAQKAIQNISLVEGDFRQEELIKMWQQVKLPTKLPVYNFRVSTSRRTYIRALVNQLEIKLDLPAVATAIIRTTNGRYKIKDCICLV